MNQNKNLKLAKIYAIVNQKGGVGKTTTAINLATALSALNKKILIIDMDPQGNASTGLGIEVAERKSTTYDLIIGNKTAKEVIVKTKIPNLKIITSTVDLSACEIELVEIENREYLLKNALNLVQNDFDAIIIDCPPSLGLLTINALCACNSIIIPMQCEFFSLEGLSHLLNTIGLVKNNLNPEIQIAGVILTMHDKRNKLTEQVEKDVRDYLGDKVYSNHIPRNIRMSEAPSYGLPGIIYDPKCHGSVAYLNLAKEVIAKEGF